VLSPDGTQLACLAPVDSVLNIWLGATGSDRLAPVTQARKRSIVDFVWTPDGRHIVFPQDRDGDEDFHLHALGLATGATRDVTPFAGVQAQVLGRSPDVPGALLVGLNRTDPHRHDAYRLDVATGKLELVAENPGFTWLPAWIADRWLQPRAGLRPRDDGGLEIHVADGSAWRRVFAVDAVDALTTSVVGFSRDADVLYLVTPAGADTAGLHALDLASGRQRALAADPDADIDYVRADPHTRAPQLVGLTKDRMRYRVLDPAVQRDIDAIATLGRGDPYITAADDADTRWVVRLEADDRPARYVLLDRRDGRATPLFEAHPRLATHEFARTEPFSLRARDGLRLHGYLTLPRGGRPPYPTVLSVHGGPYDRDRWGFDPHVQWLANRGYACLQVNFRGSTGYGKRFLAAGDKEWGGKMHDDLVDTVTWAIDEGHADARRVAIYGASYGGYAALAGAAFTPDVFRCAVALAAPTNLVTLLENAPPYWAGIIPQLRRRVGDPETDAELLWSRSPLARAHDIRIPVLLGHGRNDPRVKVSETEQLVAALRERDIPHQHVIFEDEGHGLVGQANRLRFMRTAEAFLAEHLGGAAEP